VTGKHKHQNLKTTSSAAQPSKTHFSAPISIWLTLDAGVVDLVVDVEIGEEAGEVLDGEVVKMTKRNGLLSPNSVDS